jgi:hypothetical protein
MILYILILSYFIFLYYLILSYCFSFFSSLVSGHCVRKLLQNSVTKWLKRRETLLLHRAMVDCKMSSVTEEHDNNNTINYSARDNDDGDNNSNRDSAAESRYEDFKGLEVQRRLPPSVFISSSPRPNLAVYYLRYDLHLFFNYPVLISL